MANHAHSTTASITHRQRLAAGLFAVAIGSVITSGIAAGAAASVGASVEFEYGSETELSAPQSAMQSSACRRVDA